jgi:hypothetical protein
VNDVYFRRNSLPLATQSYYLFELISSFPSLLEFLSASLVSSAKQLHKDIALIRDNEITESLYKDTICDGRKNVVKLENRLDVMTKRCGGVMAENAKLREIIDHMLQER